MHREHEVIRLIQQDGNYHIIMDYVSGESLGEYVAGQPYIEKEQFFSWISQILKQLQKMEKEKGVPCYITPFYIILKRDQTVALLNLNAKVNQKFLNKVSSKAIIKKFVPDNERKSSIYSFGKTLQFLLAKSNLTPRLTGREESRLKKIISRCLTNNIKKQYQSFKDISVNFPINRKKNRRYRMCLKCTLAILICWCIQQGGYCAPTENFVDDNEMYWDIGVSYFLVFKEYEQSRRIFESIENSQNAAYFAEISSYMQGSSGYSDLEMEYILREFSELSDGEVGIEEKVCLIRAYSKIDTPYARKQVKKLGEEVLKQSIWEEGEKEIRESLANVYQKEGEYKEALKEYEILYEQSNHEKIYKKIMELYEKCEMEEMPL